MKRQFIKQLQLEGCNPRYQGKTKTIYVDKYPSGLLLMEIEKSEFNILAQL